MLAHALLNPPSLGDRSYSGPLKYRLAASKISRALPALGPIVPITISLLLPRYYYYYYYSCLRRSNELPPPTGVQAS